MDIYWTKVSIEDPCGNAASLGEGISSSLAAILTRSAIEPALLGNFHEHPRTGRGMPNGKLATPSTTRTDVYSSKMFSNSSDAVSATPASAEREVAITISRCACCREDPWGVAGEALLTEKTPALATRADRRGTRAGFPRRLIFEDRVRSAS